MGFAHQAQGVGVEEAFAVGPGQAGAQGAEPGSNDGVGGAGGLPRREAVRISWGDRAAAGRWAMGSRDKARALELYPT